MKTIKAIPITEANFLPYGFVADIANPGEAYSLGANPCVFHRDMVVMPEKDCTPPAFGSLKVDKRAMVIEDVEFHSGCCEVMMPLDDDMVIYAGPASSDSVELDRLEAFLIPKGCLVVLRAGSWHGAPFPVHVNGTVLICLPERTYFNDTKKYILKEEDHISIEL